MAANETQVTDTAAQDTLVQIRDLEIDGITEEARVRIINGVDLDLKRGEVLGLIGESGAGKSTLGLAAMGFTRDGCEIVGGSVAFDGIDLVGATPEIRRQLLGKRIAYVAQSAAASFNPAHKIINQHSEAPLFHGLASRSEAEADAIELYRRLRLPNPDEIGFRYPHQVSGGQLQRAMTAMAMSCRPDLIIFDEPTTALDVTTQIEVLAAIREIVDQFQTAAIYITHDLAVVAQMADRVKVLLRGDEVEEADTRTMLNSPREDYTKSLWAVRSFQRPQKPAVKKGATPVISLRNVTAAYGDGDPVVRDVSFDIHEGRTVAVVGESGSGKSTTARCITGLLPPRQGEIAFDNAVLPADYRKRSLDQLRQVQMIYQMADTALNPRKRIGEIIGRPVEFYLGLKGAEKRRRVEQLLEQIELDPAEFIHRLPSELSGGQKQRIGIARALAAEPKFIICDEVTSALDQLVAEGILKLLTNLQDKMKLSYMLITHDLSTVRAIADEVVVMKDGLIVEAGPKDEMFTPPHHAYTDLLLSSVPEMDPDWLDELLKQRGLENLGDAATSRM
ncbi:MAG: ABC transporter ATP-binding protein [Candidatus Puniceispirillaceae bacterium]